MFQWATSAEAVLLRVEDRLGPGLRTGLGEDVVDVGLHRMGTEIERRCDITIGEPLGNECEDLGFSGREVVRERSRRDRSGALGYCGDAEERGLYVAVENGLPVDGTVKGASDVGPAGVLGEVAAGTSSQRVEDGGVVGVGGEHDDGDARVHCGEPPGGLDAVENGHVQVDEHGVGLVLFGKREGFDAVGGRADDGDLGQQVEHEDEPVTHRGLVVRHDDTDRFGCGVGHRGTRARTVHPPSVGPAVSAPSMRSRRSRIPASP